MRIGFIVDGDAEYRSFPLLLLRIATSNVLLTRPLRIPIHAAAPVGHICSAIARQLPILAQRGAECVVVVLDREESPSCPGDLAAAIVADARPLCPGHNIRLLEVVIKNKKYENWLVADISALRHQRQRFAVTAAVERAITPNKADGLDAVQLLRRAAKRDAYDKVADSVRIMRHATAPGIASNSRSFRRFLRVIGHESYRAQSALPAPKRGSTRT